MWVNMDHDFGLPYITFTVSLRKLKVEGLLNGHCRTPEEAEMLAESLQTYVVRHRPKMAGCQVVGISHRFGLKAEITVVHPSLARVPMGANGPREYLELCCACGKAMDAETSIHCVMLPNFTEAVVCDETCAKKLSEPML